MNKLLVICGPTATGKTALAVKFAKQLNGELISADSRQVYCGMDIGTGKDRDSLHGIPIWMYDLVNPDEAFNVSKYRQLATQAIEDIEKRGKLPIIVGGTGLYITSLIYPFTVTVEPNIELRARFSSYSKEELQKKLQEVSKSYWEEMNQSDRQNPRRLIRKIEIAEGKKQEMQHKQSVYNVCQIGLQLNMALLYKRIDDRVMKRVEEGVEEEINKLLKNGYTWSLPAMSGLGYRQWKQYFDGTQTKEETIERWKFDEHGYARRQMTWFRADKTIHWFDVTKHDVAKEIESVVTSWYTRL